WPACAAPAPARPTPYIPPRLRAACCAANWWPRDLRGADPFPTSISIWTSTTTTRSLDPRPLSDAPYPATSIYSSTHTINIYIDGLRPSYRFAPQPSRARTSRVGAAQARGARPVRERRDRPD